MAVANHETGTITHLLRRAEGGDLQARDLVFERVYPDLRRLARAFLRHRRTPFSDTATAVVNRTVERLLAGAAFSVNDRRHFFRLFVRVMHGIMIDEVRALAAKKRGGQLRRKAIEEAPGSIRHHSAELLDLADALDELRKHDPDAAEVISIRFFCGQTLEQTAVTLQCGLAAVRQNADYGIAWLRARLSR